MFTVTADLIGISPIGFSGPVQSTKEAKETHDAFERRTWKEKMHVDQEGIVFIPPMALKNLMADIAQFKGDKIPGERNATFTKHFKAGILVPDPMLLGTKADAVQPQRQFVPSDGKRGGGSRVWKMFPVIPTWRTSARMILLDSKLIAHVEKVKEYLEEGGQLVGFGWFRPQRFGYYGRYRVENFKASDK